MLTVPKNEVCFFFSLSLGPCNCVFSVSKPIFETLLLGPCRELNHGRLRKTAPNRILLCQQFHLSHGYRPVASTLRGPCMNDGIVLASAIE